MTTTDPTRLGKTQRQHLVSRLIESNVVPNQQALIDLLSSEGVTATQATGWWQGGGNASDLRVMENAFMARMEKSGFTFIDPEVLTGKITLEAIGADPNVQKAREIGRLAGAEVVVVGRAIAKPLGEMAIDNGTFYSAVANVSARAVRTDTGEVIAAAEFTSTAGKGFERQCSDDEDAGGCGDGRDGDCDEVDGLCMQRPQRHAAEGVERAGCVCVGNGDGGLPEEQRRGEKRGERGVDAQAVHEQRRSHPHEADARAVDGAVERPCAE